MNLSRLVHKLTHQFNNIGNIWSCKSEIYKFSYESLVFRNILKQGFSLISQISIIIHRSTHWLTVK